MGPKVAWPRLLAVEFPGVSRDRQHAVPASLFDGWRRFADAAVISFLLGNPGHQAWPGWWRTEDGLLPLMPFLGPAFRCAWWVIAARRLRWVLGWRVAWLACRASSRAPQAPRGCFVGYRLALLALSCSDRVARGGHSPKLKAP